MQTLNIPSSLFDYLGIDSICIDPRADPEDRRPKRVSCFPKNDLWRRRTRSEIQCWPSRLNELRRAFTYVLMAAPAASVNPHTVLLGKGTDGVILVLESRLTRREAARAIKQSLAEASIQLLGAALDKHAYAIPDKLYNML